MILGTAGHIDHGKTTLVRALTGVDTDRLPEEKRRGITIDLGFAPLVLEGVGQLGVVDVPGHEAFVRTMVAGATGIDLVLLVVAADSGVMPQTREHLAILSLLGVRSGVVALTKCDLVDAEWLALVEEDVRATLGTSSLAGAAIVPVSSTTGEGLDALRRALADVAATIPERSSDDIFRLPVDRAFTVRGTGTVVTGTVWSGTLARDATVRLFPSDTSARVRGLHVHGHVVDTVRAGDRAAIALVGVELDQVRRGAVLVQSDAWASTRVIRADVSLLPDAAVTLGPRSRVRFHLGTNEVGARLVVRDAPLEPGVTLSARVVLDEPIVVRAGDRFVLRAPSPASTLGGGIVTDPLAPLRARPWRLESRDPRTTLAALADEAGAAGVSVRELPVRLGIMPRDVEPLLATVEGWRVGSRFLSVSARDRLTRAARSVLESYHAEHPLEPGAPLQWLRSRLDAPDEVATAILTLLAASGDIVATSGVAANAAFAPTLDAAHSALRDAMIAALGSAGIEPPSLDELAASLGATSDGVLELARWLAREGSVVAVEPGRYFARIAVDGLHARMAAGMAGGKEYSPGELRDLLGLTRKFLIPFLEYCDREGYTVRVELGRRLVARPSKPSTA
ncbi:MAG TPA: selenocysteine-specific translation elongation factor [Gemmatimonadaceae bacterium]